MSNSLQPHWLQHTRRLCPSLSPRLYSDSCPLSQWCHLTISSSASPFSSCSQSFPASGFFPMSGLFTSGGQRIGDSASVLPMNIQGWFPLGLTGLKSLLSKGLSRVFFSTTIWKHRFFSTQPSLWIHIEQYQYLNPSQSFPIIILLSFKYLKDTLNFMEGNTISKVMYCTL